MEKKKDRHHHEHPEHTSEHSGKMKKNENEELNWMYEGATSHVSREDYLLGRKIDKTFEMIQNEEKEVLSNKDSNQEAANKSTYTVEHEINPESVIQKDSCNIQVDIKRKLLEDPLLLIRQNEEATKKAITSNPVKMKQLQLLIGRLKKKKKSKKKKDSHTSSESKKKKRSKQNYKDAETDKKESSAKKKKKKHRKSEKKKKRHSSPTTSDSSSESEPEKLRKKRKRQMSKNEENNSSSSSTEGVPPGRSGFREELRQRYRRGNREDVHSRKRSASEETADVKQSTESFRKRSRRSEERDYCKYREPTDWKERNYFLARKRDRGSERNGNKERNCEDELRRRRDEMVRNAGTRDEERRHNVHKFREDLRREEDEKRSPHSFLRFGVAVESSVESRIKSKVGTLQKGARHMDENFAKK